MDVHLATRNVLEGGGVSSISLESTSPRWWCGRNIREKRRTSQHRKRRNQGDEDAIRASGLKNVSSRAIAFRLHAQMNYNNNNNRENFPMGFCQTKTHDELL